MDFGLSDEQEQLVGSFETLLAKQAPGAAVRAAEPDGFDQELWWSLHDVGAVTMGVDEAHGGWGASLVDLALVAEVVGAALAPAPVLEAQVAARLLAAVDGPTGALGGVLDDGHIVTLALHPASGAAAPLVPAGAVCGACIVLAGDRLLLAEVDDEGRRPVANLADAPLADLTLGSTAELAAGPDAVEHFEAALDEWLVLMSSALVGMGAASHETVCAYARERVAFGKPIGAFQGVSHPLADDATALDGARLLTRKAAWSLAEGKPRGRELAAMAFSFASRAAASATYDGVHLHGGIGFMLEHDAQLFYRRARGWPRVWGDAERADRRAAQERYGSAGGGG